MTVLIISGDKCVQGVRRYVCDDFKLFLSIDLLLTESLLLVVYTLLQAVRYRTQAVGSVS